MITVRKEKLKVLYVDSEPRYEFRYLKNYLERDETKWDYVVQSIAE